MYPLMTNDRTLSPAEVLQAHKGQPMIDKRFEQVKTGTLWSALGRDPTDLPMKVHG